MSGKSPRKNRAREAFQRELKRLFPATGLVGEGSGRQESLSEESCEYHAFRERFPEDCEKFEQVSEDQAAREDCDTPQWCVCQQPDDGYPLVKMFRDFEVMLRYLSGLEGKEVTVWLFYGIPLRITTNQSEHARRFVLLPDRKRLATIPTSPHEPVKYLDFDLLDDVEFQDEGWLGDPSMLQGGASSYFLGSRPAPKFTPLSGMPDAPDSNDPDEFDDPPDPGSADDEF